jgi:hypothetical protein
VDITLPPPPNPCISITFWMLHFMNIDVQRAISPVWGANNRHQAIIASTPCKMLHSNVNCSEQLLCQSMMLVTLPANNTRPTATCNLQPEGLIGGGINASLTAPPTMSVQNVTAVALHGCKHMCSLPAVVTAATRARLPLYMQGSGDAACLLCALGAVYCIHHHHHHHHHQQCQFKG